MRSHRSWRVDGINPSVKERAEAAAHQAGMTLEQWIDTALTRQEPPRSSGHEVAEIHQRLDAISRQVEQFTAQPGARSDNVARQLSDAISRLDVRLSNIASPPIAPPVAPGAPAFAPQPSSPLDLSIAEIVARQNELDGATPAQAALRRTAGVSGSASDHAAFANLERQLSGITSQLMSMRQPDGVEQSITVFRSELADIRQAILEAMPRRAIESLENEIRTLGRRIDESHHHGADGNALAGIERALSEIRTELRSLTPAEQLTGFDDALRHLGGKIDSIVRSSQDPGTIQQLNDAIAALKTIVASIASNEALSQLSESVRTLSAKVDQLAQAQHGDMFAALEQRIAVLTTVLEQRERAAPADSSYFDNAVRTISDRLDNLQVGSDASSTFSHVEQRVAHLLERLEAVETRPSNFGQIESGLSDIMQVLQQQRATAEAVPSRETAAMNPDFVEAIRRELSDMRVGQVETNRNTQDALEVVHNTLGHVVDRLAQIENDLRQSRPASPNPVSAMAATPVAPRMQQAPAIPPQTRPELPNPAMMQTAARPAPQSKSSAAPPMPAPMAAAPAVETSIETPAVRTEPMAAMDNAQAPNPAAAQPQTPRHLPRSPIDPDLPPDHPLEPGSRVQPARPSAAERIATSEIAIQDIPAKPAEPVSSANFIQAARRAAQAAQAEAQGKKPAKKANRVSALTDATRPTSKPGAEAASGSSRVRALLVGVSVVVIVLGTFKMAMNYLNSGDPSRAEPAAQSSVAPPAATTPADPAPAATPPAIAPSLTSPTPIDKQSLAPSSPPEDTPAQTNVPATLAPAPKPSSDITGSIPTNVAPPVLATIPGTSEPLPDSIGGPVLRTAAMKGNPNAAYEVGMRYAEGRGVPVNFEAAANWYNRAAQANITPALFRLGTFYEKGLGVKKDIDTATAYYRQAADRGNAKAMHNLAVLQADGGGKPDYKTAAYWFLKAANRGVADSQFNLGILYARGIGVAQDLGESYKWFALAAAQGDNDSARKRDDIANRLDAQALAAAKLAVQTFTVEQQPSDAVGVPAPAGGWDAQATGKQVKPQAKATKASKTKTAAN